MNRFLLIPFSISMFLILGYWFIESKSHAETVAASTRVLPARHVDFPVNLLTIDEAEQLLVKDWQTTDSKLLMFSRRRPIPPVQAFAKLNKLDTKNNQMFFTGLLNINHEKQQTKVPVVVDRISSNIFVFHAEQWHTHEQWLKKHAPEKPAA